MTDAEALKLQPGDRVLSSIGDRVALVEVVDVAPLLDGNGRPWAVRVVVSRFGQTKRGEPYPNCFRRPVELVRVPAPETAAALVVADWLDEHDEPMAAHKLRQAFPLKGEG